MIRRGNGSCVRAGLICSALLLAAGPSWADDGSWSSNWSLDNGPLYSSTENADIELSQELLDIAFDGKKAATTAIFNFHNTAAGARE